MNKLVSGRHLAFNNRQFATDNLQPAVNNLSSADYTTQNIKQPLYFKTLIFILFSLFLFSCKSTRHVIKEPIKEYGADFLFEKLKENEFKFDWISAKFKLDIVIDKKKNSLTGQLRMRKDSVLWVSFSPALGIEMARLLITTDSVKFINRINKTYFLGDYKLVNNFLDSNVDFDVLQSILLGNDLTYYEDGKFRDDVIQMDQQENMGLELLGERFGGRITFYNPVDIQNTMVYGSIADIRNYCRKMAKLLGRPNGGFIPKWYSDPVGAGHRQEAIDVMCDEFLKISSRIKRFF